MADVGSMYGGPVSELAVRVAGRPLVIVRPSEPDRLLDDPDVVAWNRRDDYMPYWAYLWPAAFLLAEAVEVEQWQTGAVALEIGCGLGLAGLAGVRAGLHVTFSDYDDAPLDFVRRSAAANGFDLAQVSTLRLDWREPPSTRFSVILGADVLYERRLVPLVADVLAALLAPEGFALIADPDRLAAAGFASVLEARGLNVQASPVSADGGELGPVRGTLYRVSRPAHS
jgi:2-polyprenyl-3-methyl-5-hydroxy-6-metoxy-1,4-benzoquinol methylase